MAGPGGNQPGGIPRDARRMRRGGTCPGFPPLPGTRGYFLVRARTFGTKTSPLITTRSNAPLSPQRAYPVAFPVPANGPIMPGYVEAVGIGYPTPAGPWNRISTACRFPAVSGTGAASLTV